MDSGTVACRKVLEDTKLLHKQKKRRAVFFASFLLPNALPVWRIAWHLVTYNEHLQGLDAARLLSETGKLQVILGSSQAMFHQISQSSS